MPTSRYVTKALTSRVISGRPEHLAAHATKASYTAPPTIPLSDSQTPNSACSSPVRNRASGTIDRRTLADSLLCLANPHDRVFTTLLVHLHKRVCCPVSARQLLLVIQPDNIQEVNAAHLLRTARLRAGYSLRELAERAGTSYSTLSDYERGTKVPALTTMARVLDAAGFSLEVSLADKTPPTRGDRDTRPRGEQLEEVLHLADQFPSRHTREMEYPILRQSVLQHAMRTSPRSADS